MSNPTSSLPPGFRFHPTDEELILHYLRNRAAASPCPVSIIAEVDIYKLDPWDLPAKALFGDREWYFFSPRDRKYPNGVRPNRAAASGYWKATGTDKPILASAAKETIGVKKALVFYKGKPPKGTKTNWIMHEYRLSGNPYAKSVRPVRLGDSSMRLDDWVLCRIYQKTGQSSPVDHGEDSAGDDTQLPSPTETTQQSLLTLPKSFSLSEIFDAADYSLMTRILGNPTEIPELDRGPVAYDQNLNQPFINHSNVNVYLTSPFPETEPSASIPELYMKRQREEGGAVVNPSKRHHGSLAHPSFGNQLDSGLSFFNPQLLLNSQLGLH